MEFEWDQSPRTTILQFSSQVDKNHKIVRKWFIRMNLPFKSFLLNEIFPKVTEPI